MTDTPLCTILSGIQQLIGGDFVPEECPAAPAFGSFVSLVLVVIVAIALLFR